MKSLIYLNELRAGSGEAKKTLLALLGLHKQITL